MESEFIDIFEKYLQHEDKLHDTTRYTETLNYWKQLMVIKFKVIGKIADFPQMREYLNKIKELIADIE